MSEAVIEPLVEGEVETQQNDTCQQMASAACASCALSGNCPILRLKQASEQMEALTEGGSYLDDLLAPDEEVDEDGRGGMVIAGYQVVGVETVDAAETSDESSGGETTAEGDPDTSIEDWYGTLFESSGIITAEKIIADHESNSEPNSTVIFIEESETPEVAERKFDNHQEIVAQQLPGPIAETSVDETAGDVVGASGESQKEPTIEDVRCEVSPLEAAPGAESVDDVRVEEVTSPRLTSDGIWVETIMPQPTVVEKATIDNQKPMPRNEPEVTPIEKPADVASPKTSPSSSAEDHQLVSKHLNFLMPVAPVSDESIEPGLEIEVVIPNGLAEFINEAAATLTAANIASDAVAGRIATEPPFVTNEAAETTIEYMETNTGIAEGWLQCDEKPEVPPAMSRIISRAPEVDNSGEKLDAITHELPEYPENQPEIEPANDPSGFVSWLARLVGIVAVRTTVGVGISVA